MSDRMDLDEFRESGLLWWTNDTPWFAPAGTNRGKIG